MTDTAPGGLPHGYVIAPDHPDCATWRADCSGGWSRRQPRADQRHILAQAMTEGSLDEMRLVLDVYGEDALKAVLADPPPGVFDRRSWAYWHVKLGCEPIPPMPTRRL